MLKVRTIYRYEVPVDDQWHEFKLHGNPLYVTTRKREVDVVEFWAFAYDPADSPIVRMFRVYGTGHPVPDRAVYWGTALAGPFVWHLFESGPSVIAGEVA